MRNYSQILIGSTTNLHKKKKFLISGVIAIKLKIAFILTYRQVFPAYDEMP